MELIKIRNNYNSDELDEEQTNSNAFKNVTTPTPTLIPTLAKESSTLNLDKSMIQINDLQNHIQKFLLKFDQSNKKNIQDSLQQLKRQLKKKYFSPEAIQSQMKFISKKIFYFPTVNLVNYITTYYGKQPNAIIFKSIALRHGDLNILKNHLQQFRSKEDSLAIQQIQHIMQNVINWGPYYFDITKLEHLSLTKKGNTKQRQYLISQFDINVVITDDIQVFARKKSITPTQFKNVELKNIAIQRLKRIATQILYQFIKQNDLVK